MKTINNAGKFDFSPLIEHRINEDSSPVQVFAAKVENYPIHLHQELEIIYVLKGSVMLRSSVDRIQLSTGDIYIVNSMDMHEISIFDDENLLLFVHIDLEAYKDYSPEIDRIIFASQSSSDNTITAIKKFILEIYIEKQAENVFNEKLNSLAIKLILHLINNCQFASRYGNTLNNNNKFKGKNIFHIQRIQRIADYIYENFNRKITLEEVAEREFISKYYLSHTLKHAVGSSFQEILTLVRIEESEKLLLSTNRSIEEVAHLSGCSSPLYYSRNFKRYFGDTPSAYRKKKISNIISNSPPELEVISSKDIMKTLILLSEGKVKQPETKINTPVILPIDLEEKRIGNHTDISMNVCLRIKNIKEMFEPYFTDMIYKICNDLTLSAIAIQYYQLIEMYDFFGSWNWMNPLFQIMKEKDLVLIVSEQNASELQAYCLEKGVKCELGKRSQTKKSEILQKTAKFFCLNRDIHKIETATATYIMLEEDMLLINSNGNLLQKREYNRLSFLPLMEGTIIHNGENHIAIHNNEGFCIFIYNTEMIDTREFILKINNIDRNYSIIEYYFKDEDYGASDIYKMLGSPKQLTQEVVTAIERAAFPKASFSTIGESFFHDLYIVLSPGESALIYMRQV